MYQPYRPDIDGLRAIAVLSVIAFHAAPQSRLFGFLGVDIFFVISGYLITNLIGRAINAGAFSIIEFYARRARRIFPALIVVLLAAWSLGWLLLTPPEFSSLGWHIFSGAWFVSNLSLWREIDYFDTAAEF